MIVVLWGHIYTHSVGPGTRVPQPLELLEHKGDSVWDVMPKEILALKRDNERQEQILFRRERVGGHCCGPTR